MRSPGFEPGFSALLASDNFLSESNAQTDCQKAWRADVLDQAFPSLDDWTTTAHGFNAELGEYIYVLRKLVEFAQCFPFDVS